MATEADIDKMLENPAEDAPPPSPETPPETPPAPPETPPAQPTGEEKKEEMDEFADLDELEDFAEPAKPKEKTPADETPEGEDPSLGIVTPESAVMLHKQVKEAYPDLYKKFPAIKTAIFKSSQYEQFFPTVQDAAEAVTVRGVYDTMEQEVAKGNIKPILNALKKNAPEAIKLLAQNFTDDLGDTELANLAAEPVIRKALETAIQDADATNNKNLKLAARYIISYLYGTKGGELPPRQQRAGTAPDPLANERAALRAREEALEIQAFTRLQTEIGDGIEASIKSYIQKHIDPTGKELNEFTRDAAVNSVYDELVDKLGKNVAHVRNITALWLQIRKNPQMAATVGPAIRRAIAGSAKPYLPTLISQKRAKALGISGNNKGVPKAGGGTGLPSGGSRGAGGNPNTPSVSLKGVDSRDIDYIQTSEDDILEGKVKLKSR